MKQAKRTQTQKNFVASTRLEIKGIKRVSDEAFFRSQRRIEVEKSSGRGI
jgi:hypothetical protein